MLPRQMRLFPDPQPLVDGLGRDFFRQLPERPGVYLMCDANETVLYVGKARNLRKRLGSYRIANSDHLSRRHLRLLRAVTRIESHECEDEVSASAKEAELLRTIRPRFNRAGTWPAPPHFVARRRLEDALHLAIADSPRVGWQLSDPLGKRSAAILRATVARLLWVAVHPRIGFSGLPNGWFHGAFRPETVIPCGPLIEAASRKLEALLCGQRNEFCDWIRAAVSEGLRGFDQKALDAEFERLTFFK